MLAGVGMFQHEILGKSQSLYLRAIWLDQGRIGSIGPVSYTHLDVYKRQMRWFV